jgi:RNA polymerase sigma-70 factor (ECF subfamily)
VDRHEPIAPDILSRLVESQAAFLAFLERRLGSHELAEELLQEAFVRGIERGGAIRDRDSAVAWFYRLLRNAVVDHARRRAAAVRSLERWADERPPLAHPDEPLQRTVCGCVSQLVETLKPEYAAALRAVDVEGKAVSSFAKEAGITPNNAAVRLHRARAALGERLQMSCGTCATHGCMNCTCV